MAFSAVYVCLFVRTYEWYDKTKTAETTITKLFTAIVSQEPSPPITGYKVKSKGIELDDRVAGVSYALYRVLSL